MGSRRLSVQQRAILQFLRDLRGGTASGADVLRAVGLSAGTLYPALARMASDGWIEAIREIGDASALGRPLRINYKLTPLGERVADTVCGDLSVTATDLEGLGWLQP